MCILYTANTDCYSFTSLVGSLRNIILRHMPCNCAHVDTTHLFKLIEIKFSNQLIEITLGNKAHLKARPVVCHVYNRAVYT